MGNCCHRIRIILWPGNDLIYLQNEFSKYEHKDQKSQEISPYYVMINYIKSEKDLASSLITSLGMVGKFMGALLAGWYTDKFGRKNSLMVYTFCHVVFTFAMAFCQNEWSFTAMRVMTMCVNVSLSQAKYTA